MEPIWHLLPYTLLTLAVTYFAELRWSAAGGLLGGLTSYHLPGTEDRDVPSKYKVGRGKPKRRPNHRVQKVVDSFSDPGVEGGQLACVRLTLDMLLFKRFYSELDRAVFFACVVASNWAARECAELAGLPAPTGLLVAFAAFSAASAGASLWKTQTDAATAPGFERGATLGAVAACVAVCCAVFALVPSTTLDLGLEQAAEELAGGLRAYAARKGLPEPPVGALTPARLAVAAGTASGALAGLSLAPAVRLARAVHLLSDPPGWAAHAMGRGLGGAARAALAKASLALPLAAPALWCPALVGAMPGPKARPLVLLAAALLQLAAFRGLLQAYSDGGLVAWYEIRHASGLKQDEAVRRMRRKLDVTNGLMAKAALQLAAPWCVGLACAAVEATSQHAAARALAGAVAVAWHAAHGTFALTTLGSLSNGLLQA